MPAGLGWHPYFPRTPHTTITAGVRAMWLTDGEMMPTALAAEPPVAALERGVAADAVALDNCFTGWSGRAVIEWPELGARLTMTAEAPLDFLVVYTPPRRPYFCVEPVSHMTDAVNQAATGRADAGLRVLEPGELVRAAITLTPEETFTLLKEINDPLVWTLVVILAVTALRVSEALGLRWSDLDFPPAAQPAL